MELKLNEVDVAKLNLQPGEVLVVSVKNDDVSGEDLRPLHEIFTTVFPNNKIILLCVGTNGDVKFEILKGESNA